MSALDGKTRNWTPWVQERWRPSVDTRVCRASGQYQVREHVEGTPMFPQWLEQWEASYD